jgi:hypothetical protein
VPGRREIGAVGEAVPIVPKRVVLKIVPRRPDPWIVRDYGEFSNIIYIIMTIQRRTKSRCGDEMGARTIILNLQLANLHYLLSLYHLHLGLCCLDAIMIWG